MLDLSDDKETKKLEREERQQFLFFVVVFTVILTLSLMIAGKMWLDHSSEKRAFEECSTNPRLLYSSECSSYDACLNICVYNKLRGDSS